MCYTVGMLAVTYIQSLLAAFAFFGFIGLTLAVLFGATTLLSGHENLWWLIIPTTAAMIALLVGTFVWLGTGPLNG